MQTMIWPATMLSVRAGEEFPLTRCAFIGVFEVMGYDSGVRDWRQDLLYSSNTGNEEFQNSRKLSITCKLTAASACSCKLAGLYA